MNFNQVNEKLKILQESKRIEDAHSLVSTIVSLLGVNECQPEELLSHGSVQREVSKFLPAQGFRNQASAYIIPHKHQIPIDIKLFWIKKTTKANLSWLIALTPNFEDNPETNATRNIGIDFVISEDASSFYIILSNQLKLRVLELSGPLTLTQREILENWSTLSKSLNEESKNYKEQFQFHLWKSFDFEPLNRKFYMELVTQFDHVVNHLKKNIDEESAKMFTTRLIGRSLFLWFLKKKEFLNQEKEYFTISSDEDQTTYYRKKLEPLFFEVLNTAVKDREYDDTLTPFLNGGLFEPIETDFYKNEKLTFPDGFFAQFFEILNRYNFTVDEGTSEYEQVAIDPEMLGRVFENLLASLNDETGKQARKSKGAFYTPREIVDYMCQQTLIEYLKTKLPETQNRDRRIEELVSMDESTFREQDHNKRRDWKKDLGKEQVIKTLDNMRVLDPAVGSGAFPMGMLNLLVKVYSRIDTSREKDLASLKRDILSRSLYGVDIDQMAIQISRLRAWLSILVDMENLKKIDPLPNLDFKFVCANTLIPLEDSAQGQLFEQQNLKDDLIRLRDKYYIATRKVDKNKLRKEYLLKIKDGGLFEKIESKRQKQLRDYNPFNPLNSSSFYDPELMHGVEKFDVVIGNPPYVSTKGRDGNNKKTLKEIFGFADDLYSHFYFKGLEITKDNTGVLSFITSKTFWTIQTKKNVRNLLLENHLIEIFDTAAPFAAMVDTCVVLVKKGKINENYKLRWLDGKNDLVNPRKYEANISIYKNAVNNVFFTPTAINLQVYKKYNKTISNLLDEWWCKIETSKKIAQNTKTLEKYRNSLKSGEVALLGTLTEGGQGLATGNNGKYIGVRAGTKQAESVKITRINKLLEANKKIKNPAFTKNFLNGKSEQEIWKIFDDLKEKYGRDIFGQGYIFRIISDEEIADMDKITDEEKKNGIDKEKPYFVPYDKGDKDGNRWWLETPFVIDWSREIVQFLKKNSGKKGQGMPVVRNQQFYFRKGLSWILTLNEQSEYQKARVKESGIFDVNAMSLFATSNLVSEKYFTCLLNSYLIFQIKKNFINGSSAFQINDARQIPIIIPSEKQFLDFELLFDEAYLIKQKQFSGIIKNNEANAKLKDIQKKLDQMVYKLYDITP